MKLSTFSITVTHKAWEGYKVIVLGDGTNVNEALAWAGKNLGASFRPKQDGRQGNLISITIERPDGTRLNIDPNALKECRCAADFEKLKKV